MNKGVVTFYPFRGMINLISNPFDYTDEKAWKKWLDSVEGAVSEYDAWGLIVSRPDCDQVLIDVLDGWQDRIKRFNGRSVVIIRPVGWGD